MRVTERLESGRVKTLLFGTKEISGKTAWNLFGLRSANFIISFDGKNVIFDVKGYGHGVGMSQAGANVMAVDGSSFTEILKHYYTGVKLEKIPDLTFKSSASPAASASVSASGSASASASASVKKS